MSGTSYLEHLATIRLFSACNKKELQKIARATDELTVEVGKVLTEQGRSGHEAFVIMDGEAAVEVGGKHVATLGTGAHFGELALLDGGPRTGDGHGHHRAHGARDQPTCVLLAARRGARASRARS